jgi:hypothetical protein
LLGSIEQQIVQGNKKKISLNEFDVLDEARQMNSSAFLESIMEKAEVGQS